MSTPKEQLLAAIKLSLKSMPTFSHVIFDRTLHESTITAVTADGTAVATLRIAQRLVPPGKGGQLTVDDVRRVPVEAPPQEPTRAPAPLSGCFPLGFYASDLAKLSAGQLDELDSILDDGLVLDAIGEASDRWWSAAVLSPVERARVLRVFGEWCPVTSRSRDDEFDRMVAAALDNGREVAPSEVAPSEVAKRWRDAQFAAARASITATPEQIDAVLGPDPVEPAEDVAIPPAVTRLWIATPAWRALAAVTRVHLTAPLGTDDPMGATVEWHDATGVDGYVTALVPEGQALEMLRAVARSAGVAMTEGERPVLMSALDELTAAAAPMIANATGPVQHRTMRPVAEIRAEIEAEESAKESAKHEPALRQRVLIVSDAGDWSRARRGLRAWSAEHTPGAGTQSGGSCAPLVMMHTPMVASDDVATLLARLAKDKRRVLDLGEVPAAEVFDCAPSNRRVRERWNEAHPVARVSVGGEVVVTGAVEAAAKPAKKPRGAKASREVSA